MDTNEKIKRLQLRAKDISLPRQERSEAQEELQWVRFRKDRRPVVSYRKYVFSEFLLNASTTMTFGFMFIRDMIGKKHSDWNLLGIMYVILVVLSLAAICYYSHIKAKFKTEPPDELSKLTMAKSANSAAAALFIFLILLIVAVFMFSRVKTITLNGSNCLYLLVTLEFFHATLTKHFYLACDREDEAAEEDE
ncbi:hypothetical protein SAMN02910447_02815 [Ruminococcus sp. YE71]|uniref:hypothetical protein n=1 Tax=unclassified Ruminococcus TaxID=2608920 RepID=UPI00088A8074|nr:MULTISPECIES: hypothetical protein [unclassified Ruminococcus]SDA27147.1 hypothetical protein SAMN02910446_02737 [Ruminococcus sp. YE78]SFW45484.1 hypothetical protein SAMN02910447_02815 [Ruminococcus sp. YE71]